MTIPLLLDIFIYVFFYFIFSGIQYYLEKSGRIDNIFSDYLFEPFIDALNEEAKKFQQTFANSMYLRVIKPY